MADEISSPKSRGRSGTLSCRKGKRHGRKKATQPSPELATRLSLASSGDAADLAGVRVPLARSIVTLFPPSGHVMTPDGGLPPSKRLELFHAFGYNGSKCRNSVHISRDGKVCYTLAAVGVVMNKEDNTQQFFKSHNEAYSDPGPQSRLTLALPLL